MTKKYNSTGICVYKCINEKENKHEQLGCLENVNQARKIAKELNFLQEWGEGNIAVAYSLAQYLKAYEEILDAFIKGIESEKGIDPDNEVFQKSMNCTLKYLKRLKEEFENVDDYLKKKNELEKEKELKE